MDINLSNGKMTPTRVAELHQRLAETPATSVPTLTPTQLLRARAVGEMFSEVRPSLTTEDESNLGIILSDLAGWILWGADYDNGGE